MRPRWEKPELIALVRSRPEEGVLAACKTVSTGVTPGAYAQHCGHMSSGSCGACSSRGGS